MAAARKLEPLYTYEDYRKVPENGVKLELIDGKIRAMASATSGHQEISLNLSARLREHLRKKGSKCRVIQDVDTRLNYAQGDKTAVRPDVLVVCSPSKIYRGTVIGAPDFVAEIWSPSNTHKERVEKFAKYREAKVREIWFIDPKTKIVETYCLDEASGRYVSYLYTEDDDINVGIFPNLLIEGAELFDTIEDTDDDEEEER